ncbi:MAG TPA: alpha/beta hydrolase [Nitrospinota bacterium]|nr:alpha/beta hydrolase [Nitrospinota bacterium]|tara:strand:- start:99461 stop:100249 length:789 start_codon:yes stop_codon:yes gene_type:complete
MSVRKAPLPLLMIHGWGHSKSVFKLLRAELPNLYRAYAFDLPGHGDAMSCRGPYTYDRYVKDIQRFTANELSDGFHLLGWSMGGSIAAKYLLDGLKPSPRSLILICAPARFAEEGGTGLGYGQSRVALKKMRRSISSNSNEALREFIYTLFDAGEIIDGQQTKQIESLLVADPFPPPTDVLMQTLDELEKIDLTSQNFTDNNCPVLLIHGALDKICPTGGQKLWDALFPRISRVTLPGCGHAPHLTRPRELAQEISQFLGRL